MRVIFYILGAAFFVFLIAFNWSEPRVMHFGESEMMRPQGALKLWLGRYFYMHLLLAAAYRSWAESTENEFPPYNPFVMVLAVYVPMALISAFIQYA